MKRILLLEDDTDVRFVLENVLVAAGYGTDCAGSTREARAYLGLGTYDLVIADLKLDDGDGIDIADLASGRGAKTLIVSGHATSYSARALARHPYLLKPVHAAEIERRVAELIGPGEAHRTH